MMLCAEMCVMQLLGSFFYRPAKPETTVGKSGKLGTSVQALLVRYRLKKGEAK